MINYILRLDFDIEETIFNILKLNRYWIKRFDVPFYTLGRNAYLDGKTKAYYKESRSLNKKLATHFDDLYKEVQTILGLIVNEPVELGHEFALPSFHIFKSDPIFLDYPQNWHTDYPRTILGIEEEESPKEWSFTVPIVLPESGGGLDYKKNNKIKHLEYEVGDIIVHKGDFLHSISNLKEYKENEYRITLQGHIMRRNGRLVMYW